MADMKKMFTSIPSDTHRRAKSRAAMMGVDLREFVTYSIESYLLKLENEEKGADAENINDLISE